MQVFSKKLVPAKTKNSWHKIGTISFALLMEYVMISELSYIPKDIKSSEEQHGKG